MLQLEAPVNTTQILGQSQQLVPDVAAQAAQRQLMQAQAAEAQQNLQFRNIALQRQQSFGADMQNFLTRPSVSGVAAMFGKYPEFQQQIQDAWGTLSAEQKRSELTQLGSAAALTAKGDYDGAADLVNSRIQADQAAGRDTSTLQQMQALLQTKDPTKITPVLGMMSAYIAGGVGADKAKDFLSSIGLDQTPQKLSPGEKEVNAVTGQTVASSPALSTAQILNTPSGGQQLYGFNPNDGSINGGAAASTQPGGGGPASGGGAAYPAGTPRSVRNNNPGNLKATPFTRSLPGYTGVDNAGYAIFSSPDQGLAAQTQLLSGKAYFAGGKNTVASIVSKWAPSKIVGGDNSPAQTANYISYVSQALGVKPNDVLSPQQLPQLAQAMSQFEAGATHGAGAVRVPPAAPQVAQNGAPGNVSAPLSGPQPLVSTDNGGLNTKGAEPGYAWNATHTAQIPVPGTPNDPNSYAPQEIDDLARNWIATGPTAFASLGGGMGGGGGIAQLKKAALARATQIMAQSGITADQLPAIRSKFSAFNSSMTQNTQILNMLEASENALHANAQQVLQTQKKLVDNGIISNTSPTINNARIATYSHIGSAQTKADIKAYQDAVNGLTQEYTKFMNSANGMGGNAAPSDTARGLAMDLNDEGQGPATMASHIKQIFIETGNKRAGIGAQNQAIQNKLSTLIGGQPQQAQPQQTVVRTGVDRKTGRRVVQYSDGSIAYGN